MALIGLLIMLVLAILNAAPLAFFAMLFLGNVEIHLSFLDLLPGAMAAYCIKNNMFSYTKGTN